MINCANNAILAFSTLVALTSFAISLWLSEFEEESFDEAFTTLAERDVDPMPRAWLEYLRESAVCKFAPGARPGGYLNPYTTGWAPALESFTRAHVPFWLIWGRVWTVDPSEVRFPKILEDFFPPQKYIELAQRQRLTFGHVILPSALNHNPNYRIPSPPALVSYAANSPHRAPALNSPRQPPTDVGGPDMLAGLDNFLIDDPAAFKDIRNENRDEPPPPPQPVDRRATVEQGSNQRAGESWEEFRARYTAALERRKAGEDDRQRMIRESREQEAVKHGPTKKSTLYVWEQDEVDKTFYRRTRIIRHYVRVEYKDATHYQRFFWPHVNEWDIVRHIPAWPAGKPKVYDQNSDNDSDSDGETQPARNTEFDVHPASPGGRTSLPSLGPMRDSLLEAVNTIAGRENEPETPAFRYTFVTLVTYLKDRYGFTVDESRCWNPSLHVAKCSLKQRDWTIVVKNLCYVPQQGHSANMWSSIIDFHNITRNSPSYTVLPANWDISRLSTTFWNMQKFRVERIASALYQGPVYIIRPPSRTRDNSGWFIAVRSPTAVLMAYRSPCRTMYELGRMFLNYGIRFNTVVERRCQDNPKPLKSRVRGLGERPSKFIPGRADYLAYRQASDSVLRTGDARALFLLGGIVGRLASEVVPDYKVLDGPNLVNVLVVATAGSLEYVDDVPNPDHIDIVCGVYRVRNKRYAEATNHLSWWPRPGPFDVSGYGSDHWAPMAEAWYQRRTTDFQMDEYKLMTAQDWRANIKLSGGHLQDVIRASERMATDFLDNSSRVR